MNMADKNKAEALIHGSQWNSVDDLWDKEIEDASVIKLSNGIQIKYTFLTGVALYYSDNDEPEASTQGGFDAFASISATSNLANAFKF